MTLFLLTAPIDGRPLIVALPWSQPTIGRLCPVKGNCEPSARRMESEPRMCKYEDRTLCNFFYFFWKPLLTVLVGTIILNHHPTGRGDCRAYGSPCRSEDA